MSWAAVLGLSLGAYAFKLVGVVAGERFAARLAPVTVLLPAALFSALVVVMPWPMVGPWWLTVGWSGLRLERWPWRAGLLSSLWSWSPWPLRPGCDC